MRLTQSQKAVAAVILLVLGIAFGGIARLAASAEQTSYFGHTSAPEFAHVTADQTYLLSVHGGSKALADQGLNAAGLACSYITPTDPTLRSLKLTAEAADSNATNTIATFSAPVGGAIRIVCPTYSGAVFLDGADNAPFDLAGLYLLLCVLALTLGVALAVSAMRSAGAPAVPSA